MALHLNGQSGDGEIPQDREPTEAEMQQKHIDMLHCLSLVEQQAREARMNLIMAMENHKAAMRMGAVEIADPSVAMRLANSAGGRSAEPINLGASHRDAILQDCRNRFAQMDVLVTQSRDLMNKAAALRGL